MHNVEAARKGQFYIYTLIVGMIILLSSLWNAYTIWSQHISLAEKEALSLFNKDVAYRYWASAHGGVYVPVDDKTEPNPYLAHVPERDITTPSGRDLTLMNPAYILRQTMKEFELLYGVKGHITSLIHFRPETAPDAWETKQLQAFEKGQTRSQEIIDENGTTYLRYMQPLITQESCLKCHAFQGYKVGDVRGGVSISVPLESYRQSAIHAIKTSMAAHGLILLGTMVLMYLIYLRYSHQIRRRREAEASQQALRGQLEKIYSLTDQGIIIYETTDNGETFHIRELNLAVERIENIRRKDIIGHKLLDVFPQASEFGLVNAMRTVYQSGEQVILPPTYYDDGRVRGWRQNKIIKLDETNILVLYSDITREMEQIRQLEERNRQITETHNYLTTILDTDNDLIITTKQGIALVTANQTFFDFAGYPDIDSFKREHDCICDLFEEDPNVSVLQRQMGEANWLDYLLAHPGQHHMARMKGRLFSVDMNPLKGSEEIYLVVFSDITELHAYQTSLEKRIDEEIAKRRMNEQLLIEQSKVAAMGEVMTSIAHHWRQPLNVIALETQDLKDAFENGEINQDYIDNISNIMMKEIN